MKRGISDLLCNSSVTAALLLSSTNQAFPPWGGRETGMVSQKTAHWSDIKIFCLGLQFEHRFYRAHSPNTTLWIQKYKKEEGEVIQIVSERCISGCFHSISQVYIHRYSLKNKTQIDMKFKQQHHHHLPLVVSNHPDIPVFPTAPTKCFFSWKFQCQWDLCVSLLFILW